MPKCLPKKQVPNNKKPSFKRAPAKKAPAKKEPDWSDLSQRIQRIFMGDGTKKDSKKVALKLLKIKEEVQQATTDMVECLVEDEEQQLEQLDMEFDFDHHRRVFDWINAGQLSVEGLTRPEKMVVGLFACTHLHELLTNQLSEFQDDEDDDQDDDQEDDQDEDQEDDQEDDHEADEELIEDLIDRMTTEFDQVAQLDDPDWRNVDFLEQMQEAFDQEF